MKLSADLFNQIIANLKSDGSGLRGAEHRKQGRVGLRCALELVPCSGKSLKPLTVWVRDISVNGIGVVASSKLAENLEFLANFGRDAQMPLAILYRVRYCRRISDELFSIGAVFDRVMPDASGAIPAIGQKSKSTSKKNAR